MTTAPHYRTLTGRVKKAADKTISDTTIQNRRAVELRRQRAETLMESAPAMSSHELTEALAAVTDTDNAPASPPVVRIGVPATVGPTTTPDALRLAMLARFPIRGATTYEGVPTDAL